MSIIIVYMPVYTLKRDPFSLSLSVLLSVFVRDSTNYTPCQRTTSDFRDAFLKRTFVARRKHSGTYCGGCNQLLPSSISDGHCCFLKRSKHSFRMRLHLQPSCQRSDGLIRRCSAIRVTSGCRTSDWLLRSMSYPLSMF